MQEPTVRARCLRCGQTVRARAFSFQSASYGLEIAPCPACGALACVRATGRRTDLRPVGITPPDDGDTAVIEEAVARQCVDALKAAGYIVLKTTVRYRRTWNAREGYGADRGIPDLLVTRDDWPPYTWLGIECKRPKGWRFSSRPQAELWARRRIVVVTSAAEALAAAAASFTPQG